MEIKFKVYDKEEKRMSFPFDWTMMVINFSGTDFVPAEFAATRKERFEFLQFTGLFDKAGREIFTGDIIEIYIPHSYDEFTGEKCGRRIKAEINFHSGCFWFDGDGFTDCNWHFYNAEDRKVIGNRWEK